jgi:NAD(P)-dependent dehydrogenase (short-subunit alcohol dehydrogenase family)
MKKAIITGAAGNLGRFVCRHFNDLGIAVIALVGEKDETGFLSTENHNAVYRLDLTSPAQVESILNQIISVHGVPDFGIFLAGGYASGNVLTTTSDDIQKMLHINFDTCFHLSKLLFAKMTSNHVKGRFCFIGARPAIEPAHSIDAIAYALSKSLVVNWARNLNASGKPHGIRAFCVIPGTMDTITNRKAMPEVDFSQWVAPEAVAQAIHFGCTNKDLTSTDFLMFGDF